MSLFAINRQVLRRFALAASLAIAGFAGFSGPQAGGEAEAAGRENPFLPQTTTSEDNLIQQRNTIAQVVRDMLPELQSSMEKSFDAKQKATLDELRATAAELQRSAANRHDTGPNKAVSPISTLPPDAMFVACAHGDTAIYRDKKTNQIRAIKPTEDNPTPCY